MHFSAKRGLAIACRPFDRKLRAAEWLQIAQRSQWKAHRKPPSLLRMVPSLTPYDLPFPQNGVPYAPKTREWPYLRNGSFDPLI